MTKDGRKTKGGSRNISGRATKPRTESQPKTKTKTETKAKSKTKLKSKTKVIGKSAVKTASKAARKTAHTTARKTERSAAAQSTRQAATRAGRKVRTVSDKVRRGPSDERVSQRLSIIAKRLDQTLAAMHARTFAISISNWKIMHAIALSGPLSASTLGALTSLDPDKITRAVDVLVQKGYVVRRDDEADRRRVILTLSAKGKRVSDKIEAATVTMEAEFLGVLTAGERRVLLSSLVKLDEKSGEMFSRRDDTRRGGGAARRTARAGTAGAVAGRRFALAE